MSELADIDSYKRLIKILQMFERVKQLSWNISQTKNRYPSPESMTKDELDNLFKFYLALGFDIEEIYKDWKEFYKEYATKSKVENSIK